MGQQLVLQEDGFSLEFHIINDLTHGDHNSLLTDAVSDGYVLQERMIVPPHLITKAPSFSASAIAASRSNPPLILVGHPGLPVQYASVVARPETGKSKAEKYNKAIKVSAKGMSVLFSAPIFSPSARTEQCLSSAFSEIGEVFSACKMRDAAIARTWLFMEDIASDYDLLNKARERFFKDQQDGCTTPFFPASTSIQGRVVGSTLLSIEFCAFSGEGLALWQQSSPLQNEPTTYGKLFSRAVVVRFPKNTLLFISGTASINKTGESVYIGDFERQMAFILEVVSAILHQINGNFSNVAQAIIYLKRSKDLVSCRRLLDAAGFPCAKTMFQLDTPVCRDDLLCEMEVTALFS
jgi:enamine deaminase RidA (YjgF/YER057c/UK114 family)